MAPKVPPRRKYRTNCNSKNMRQLNVRVPKEIHDLVEFNSYDENGRKLSKDKVVSDMITFAAPRMMKSKSL